ncbi:alk-exo [Anopheles sinensis]|uniref:Alk-exo n=1 Tax=Anopheles sinensis TaxID=74873 RepID=A0A084WC61_ANOSI|nr:alk-exo [Anopheles sinensis]
MTPKLRGAVGALVLVLLLHCIAPGSGYQHLKSGFRATEQFEYECMPVEAYFCGRWGINLG